jgi:hypothetical protein
LSSRYTNVFYKRAPHPTKLAHLSHLNVQWLNAALLYQLQMRQTFTCAAGGRGC